MGHTEVPNSPDRRQCRIVGSGAASWLAVAFYCHAAGGGKTLRIGRLRQSRQDLEVRWGNPLTCCVRSFELMIVCTLCRFSSGENQWKCEETLKGHKDWVRDVAWCPSIGLASSTLAS